MQDSQFGFSYSWSDLRPIWPLVAAVTVAELAGSAIGYKVLTVQDGFSRLWFGGALAALPGYALGLLVQLLLRPERFQTHRVLIRRIGLLAALLSLIAVFRLIYELHG